jgi:hypothetical protein
MTSCQYPRGFNEWPQDRKNEWFADEARKYREAKKAAKPNGDGARALSKTFEAATTAAEESLISKRASDVVPESISWLWRDRFPHRRLSVLTGPPGLGKSQITAFLAATITTGREWPDGSPCGVKGSVIILSAEDDVADTIVPRLPAAGADLDKVAIVEAVQAKPEGGQDKAHERGFDLSRDVGRLEGLCISENAVLIAIDPISAYFGKGSDSHVNSDVRWLLAPLAALAAKCRAAVVAITHDRKSGGSAGERTLGSVAFIAAPRAVWAVTPEICEEGELSGRNILTRIKGNLGPDPGGLAYEIEACRIGSKIEPDGISTSRIKWHEGAIAKTADQLYAAATNPLKKREAPARDDAEEFLRELLAGKKLPVTQIESQAKAAGVTLATVRGAREKLGIRPFRKGFGKGGIWYWELAGAAIDAHVAQDREGGEHLWETAIDAVSSLKNGEHLCKNVSNYGEIPIDAHQVEGSAHSSHPIDAHEPPPIRAHHMDDENWGLD